MWLWSPPPHPRVLLGGFLRFVGEERTVKDGTFPSTPCTVNLTKACRHLGHFDEWMSLAFIWLHLLPSPCPPPPMNKSFRQRNRLMCVSADWFIALVLFSWADWWWARKLLNYGHLIELMAEKKIQAGCGSLMEFVGFRDKKWTSMDVNAACALQWTLP